MKVLIVAETDKILDEYSAFFNARKYDILKYRWLMKALDNLEELEPDVCVISASDYPRHWKTFVQFLHATITSKNPEIVLITPDNFSDEEKEKAKALGITKVIMQSVNPEECSLLTSFDKGEQNLETVTESEDVKETDTVTETETDKIINSEISDSIESENITECINAEKEDSEISDSIESENVTECQDTKFIFTLPQSYQIINGIVIKFDYPMIYFIPADSELITKLKIGQLIESCTLKTGNFTESVRGQIRNISESLEICILK